MEVKPGGKGSETGLKEVVLWDRGSEKEIQALTSSEPVFVFEHDFSFEILMCLIIQPGLPNAISSAMFLAHCKQQALVDTDTQ